METRYDPTGGGGTTTLDYDPHRRQLVRDFVSLNGTVVNCAGGKGLGDRSWITGEEIITTIGGKKHGYNFEVPLARSGPALTQPLVAMGRFAHEAVATDPASGIVYETEDAGSGRGSGFYRYIDAPDANPLAATNGDGLASGTSGPFAEGYAKGGAKFNRLEGIWYGDGGIFFDSTSGGDAKSPEAPKADGYREGYGQINRLVGLTRSGEAFEFAINRFNDSELAGPCFSPDATTLFVNIFGDGTAGSGMTVAIRGPWARGAL